LKYQQAKKIIFVFLVFSIVSSLSAVTFVTGNNLVFAKKNGGSSSSGGGGGSDKGGGGDNGGGGSGDNGGGTTTTEGTDNSNNADTGTTNTQPPPPEDQKTCPDGSNPDDSGNCPQATNQKTCPDGSNPDESGNCPTTTPTPCPDGSTPDESGNCPQATNQKTCPDGSTPDESGNCPTTTPTPCPDGSIPDPTTGNCPTTTQQNTAPQTLTQQTCPPLPIDQNGNCPGIDMRGGGLGLPPLKKTCPPLPIDQNGNCPGIDMRGGGLELPPAPPKPIALGDGSFQLPTLPAKTDTGTIAPICPKGSQLVGSKCVVEGVSCPSGTVQDGDKCLPLAQENCPPTTPILFQGKCVDKLPVIAGSSTGAGGGFIQMFPVKPDGSIGSSGAVVVYVPANKDGSCTPGDDPSSGGYCRHKLQSAANTGGGGTEGTTTGTTTTTTPPKPTTQTGTTGTGGTTTTSTGNPTTPTTTTTTTAPTSTTTTNVNRGTSSGGGGSSTTAATSPAQANNNFLTYVNAINKITIKYPSTWTKTEFAGNPSIPVMFNAPTAATTTAAKTNFVISITPSASNLDSFTQQQINGLTQSNAVKYTITDTDAKVLTPPNGITAFSEVSYDGIKNDLPLKGTAIFFVNSGTGYSLLYLAKQTEYTQNLPMIQQMISSFQIGGVSSSSGNTNAATGISSGGSPVATSASLEDLFKKQLNRQNIS
jgi:PsbP-like protein